MSSFQEASMSISNFQLQYILRSYSQVLADRTRASKVYVNKEEVTISSESKKGLLVDSVVQEIMGQSTNGIQLNETGLNISDQLSQEYGHSLEISAHHSMKNGLFEELKPMNQPPEIINGQKLIETLKVLSEGRCLCKMEIPHTRYGWITLILGLQPAGNSYYLLIDKVSGFENALSHSETQEISIEFLEPDGILCQLNTRVFKCSPGAIWAEPPESIYRIQRRRYFRVKARLGTAIVFHLDQAGEGKADVRDYSLGGLAFFMDRHLKLTVGDQLKKNELRILRKSEPVSFHIPTAIVRRIEPQAGGKDVCALEFLEISDATTEQLWRHIFKEQRLVLRKIKRV